MSQRNEVLDPLEAVGAELDMKLRAKEKEFLIPGTTRRPKPGKGIGLAERTLARGVVLSEPADAQREIDRLTGKRIAPE